MSELSLTSLPMQGSCFSKVPLSIPSALFLPVSFFFFNTPAPIPLSLHLPHSFFSHCHIPLTLCVLSVSVSLKLLAFSPFGSCHFDFHLSLSEVQSSLYANNVPVLRKEAA